MAQPESSGGTACSRSCVSPSSSPTTTTSTSAARAAVSRPRCTARRYDAGGNGPARRAAPRGRSESPAGPLRAAAPRPALPSTRPEWARHPGMIASRRAPTARVTPPSATNAWPDPTTSPSIPRRPGSPAFSTRRGGLDSRALMSAAGQHPKLGQSPQGDVVPVAQLRAHGPRLREAAGERGESDLCLDPGEGGSQAEVGAEPEGEMT